MWISNAAGFIGYGNELITNALPAGRHKITLSVADGLGGESLAEVFLKIVHPS
jgi:hypothetical protein